MSAELFFYSVDVVGNFATLLSWGMVIAIIGAFACTFTWFIDKSQPAGKAAFRFAITAVIIGLSLVPIPSKSTMYLMAGAHVAKELAVSETGKKVQQLVNQKLDELLAEKKK